LTLTILINNHFSTIISMTKKDISENLQQKLLGQHFMNDVDNDLKQCVFEVARSYALAENAIAVVSNLKTKKSTIYYGGTGEKLGIADKGTIHQIDSIWEEEIFERIHPDDLIDKQLQELEYFSYIKSLKNGHCCDFYLTNRMRMRDNTGTYHYITHRILYFGQPKENNVWLALCLYMIATDEASVPLIINTLTGESRPLTKRNYQNPLSKRECAVLSLIGKGLSSKEIAEQLFISYNTVSQHRQNILSKLNVSNSVEAYQLAKRLKLI
jgi:DNA-binding CsgD family transcriptional regulator